MEQTHVRAQIAIVNVRDTGATDLRKLMIFRSADSLDY
jgi:hypothetical protein